MDSNLVIAAIPDENDPVWKVSSEKIPHLTLLFLGDANAVSNLEQIMLFVEHAANTSLKRFSLSVDHRGELGDDKADVLFFKKSRYDFKAIRDFRATLLQDQNIRTAYDSATQFDGPWNPHLTLGYPETPANEVPDSPFDRFYGVEFNKIAVWTDDFEGPDWLLKDYWDELDTLDIPMDVPMDVAWSGLSHATTVSDTPWSKFKDSDYDDSQYARACLLDRGQDTGTAKQRYGIPVREPDGTLNRNACHAAASVLSSIGGTGTARGNKVKGTPEQIALAKKKLVSLYKSALNEDVPKGLGGEDSVKQTTELGSEFLEHVGVKGMKWGVRKDRNVETVGKLQNLNTRAKSGDQKTVVKGDDKRFNRVGKKADTYLALHDRAVKAAKSDRQAINNKPEFKKASFGFKPKVTIQVRGKDYGTELHKKYKDEHYQNYVKHFNDQANKVTNQSGTKQYAFRDIPNAGKFSAKRELYVKDIKHADVSDAVGDGVLIVELVEDADGKVIDYKSTPVVPSARHTAELGAEFIEHYGIKGMHWGVRRQGAVTTRAHIDSGILKRQTRIQAKGGEAHPPTHDAIKAAVNKQKLKKSGVAALSNTELRDLQTRLQLEIQVKQLTSSKGQKAIAKTLEEEGKQQLSRGVRKAGPSAFKKARKGAATVATTAALL